MDILRFSFDKYVADMTKGIKNDLLISLIKNSHMKKYDNKEVEIGIRNPNNTRYVSSVSKNRTYKARRFKNHIYYYLNGTTSLLFLKKE